MTALTTPARVFVAVLLALLASCSSHSSSSTGTTAGASGAATIQRLHFSVDVPPGWEDATEADDDHDRVVDIDGPDECFFRASETSKPIDADRRVELSVAAEKRSMFDGPPEETPFTEWGPLRGSGKELSGKTQFKGERRARIFAYAGEKHTWAVFESCPVASWAKNESAFVAIRRSYRIVE